MSGGHRAQNLIPSTDFGTLPSGNLSSGEGPADLGIRPRNPTTLVRRPGATEPSGRPSPSHLLFLVLLEIFVLLERRVASHRDALSAEQVLSPTSEESRCVVSHRSCEVRFPAWRQPGGLVFHRAPSPYRTSRSVRSDHSGRQESTLAWRMTFQMEPAQVRSVSLHRPLLGLRSWS